MRTTTKQDRFQARRTSADPLIVRGLPPAPVLDHRLGPALADVTKRSWFTNIFHGSLPGRVPRSYRYFADLVNSGVIDGAGVAQLRVNRLAGRLFLTDGSWHQSRSGLFPYTDEAEMLLSYLGRHGLLYGVECVLDVGAGCGHTIVSHPCEQKLASDINARARAFITVNAALNNSRVLFHRQDARDPVSPKLAQAMHRPALIIGNLPFALSPKDVALPLSADGGPTGIDITLAVLRSSAQLRGSTVVLLTNSLYSSTRHTWQIVELARKHLPSATIQWRLLKDVHVWRVNGRREQRNPMSVRRALPRKADCTINVPDHQRSAARNAYKDLARWLCDKGWDRLGCGVLHVKLP